MPSEQDDDGEVAVVPLANAKGKRAVTRSGSVGVNGKAKGKGKEKSDSHKKITRPAAHAVDVMEINDIEDTEGELAAQPTTDVLSAAKRQKKAVVLTTQVAKDNVASRERMGQNLDMYEEVGCLFLLIDHKYHYICLSA